MWILLLLGIGVGARSSSDDEQHLGTFRGLSLEQQAAFCGALREATRALDTRSARLIASALALSDREVSSWPALEPAPIYDPEVHAPGAVARRVLPADSARVRAARQRFLGRIEEPQLDVAWTYDYGARELRRAEAADQPERLFRNALAGFAPDHDLAEALVLRTLDDGSQSAVLGALAHAYTSREGEVFTGLTLYDALGSREQIEMPDVDCLGVIHDVFDDWKTWTAPVPQAQHERLYDRIEELFVDARVHRSVRESLARVYLRGEAQLVPRMRPHLGRFHSLWASLESDPRRLAEQLPPAEEWRSWISEQGRSLDTELELVEAGRERREALTSDAARVRELALELLADWPADGE